MKILDLTFRLFIFCFFGGLFVLALLAPFIQHFQGYPHGEPIYEFLSPICHQYPTRSLWIFAQPFALCSRCSFGYLGLALSAIYLKLEVKYSQRFLVGILIFLIAIVDPIFQLFSVYESENSLRVFSGLLGGMGIFLIIHPFRKVK